jgi:prephenate dehydratase
MKVALLGPEGTYTHQAAEKYFQDLEPEFCSTIEEVFKSDVDKKLVPIENSLGGGVKDTIDLLRQREEKISAEVKLPIRHALISGEEEISDVKTVRSHPQALSQCREFIEEHDLEKKEESSTAAAVENLESGEAALASKVAAEVNEEVHILDENVQDDDSNVTRFFVLNGETSEGEKTSLILEPGEDRPGLLGSMLSCFSGHGINLAHIQSRPTREGLGEYYFYVEAETGRGENLDKAKKCLETYAEVRDLGTYMEDDSQ